ncbi:MAG: cytosine permease [Acidobacteria bacterium]|nr:cytosine permease [Acidobacteriota bacterium]
MAALPDYIVRATPNPPSNRAPWYKNTAPSYAGIFLWIGFYMTIAEGTISRAGLAVCLAGLVAAGLASYALFYYVPAMLGMKTGYPLYVVGASTFGTQGGYLMPGLLMGLLQIGWFSVGTFISTTFILKGLGLEAQPGRPVFMLVAVLWAVALTIVGVKGIAYVARFAMVLNVVPLLMLLIVFARTAGASGGYRPAENNAWLGFVTTVQIVIGFFATAGAAGADFGLNSRDQRDVRLGGWVGIALSTVIAGGLPLVGVAGAHALDPGISSYRFDAAIGFLGGWLATAMFFLFAIASVAPGCFCAFIAGNSFGTMLPKIPRMASTMVGGLIAAGLAGTGVAENMIGFFTIVGASFGPVCGAMAADYLLAGKQWAGPRQGISVPGYAAWAVGFLVGLIPFLPVSEGVKQMAQPAALYSMVAGFVVYYALAQAGLEPARVEAAGAGAGRRS